MPSIISTLGAIKLADKLLAFINETSGPEVCCHSIEMISPSESLACALSCTLVFSLTLWVGLVLTIGAIFEVSEPPQPKSKKI